MTARLALGSPAPAFAGLQGVDGLQHGLADYAAAKALAIIFWCNHCPYVQAYEDRIKALQQELGPKGLQVVAINSNDAAAYPEDSFAGMEARAKARGFNFPYLRDESQQAAREFGALRTPHIFLFDAERKLAYLGRVDDNYADPGLVKRQELREAVDDILEGRPVRTPETFAIGCTIKWKA